MAARRSRRYDYNDPWWRRDFGGMPGWLIVSICAVIGVITVAALSRFL